MFSLEAWRKFRRLPAAERGLLVRAVLLLPTMAAALRVVGFPRLTRWLGPRVARVPAPPVEPAALARIVALAARRGPVRARCLTQAVTLWWLLARRGIASQVRLGVVKENGALKAHAWLVGTGGVVAECGSDRNDFVPFDRAVLPSSETHSR